MKAISIFMFASLIFLTSCFGCKWVSTGHHHGYDGEVIEDGYWDCPDENTINDNTYYFPVLNQNFKHQQIRAVGSNEFVCEVIVENVGSAEAYSIHCNVEIIRPSWISVSEDNTFEYSSEMGILEARKKKTFSFRFIDNYISGSGFYDIKVTLTYKDKNGKSYNLIDYYEM